VPHLDARVRPEIETRVGQCLGGWLDPTMRTCAVDFKERARTALEAADNIAMKATPSSNSASDGF
jgi:hypothetical protein